MGGVHTCLDKTSPLTFSLAYNQCCVFGAQPPSEALPTTLKGHLSVMVEVYSWCSVCCAGGLSTRQRGEAASVERHTLNCIRCVRHNGNSITRACVGACACMCVSKLHLRGCYG